MFLCFLWVVCARAGADNLREVELGDSCMARFDLFHALQHYEVALAQRDDATVRMRLAECHYRRHDYAKCILVLKPVPAAYTVMPGQSLWSIATDVLEPRDPGVLLLARRHPLGELAGRRG